MELLGLSLVLVVTILAGVSAEPQCAVSMPSLLKSGENAEACLMVSRNTESMDVNATLQVFDDVIQVIKTNIPPGSIFECFNFEVPAMEKASPVNFLVTAISGDFNYTARQPVVITPTGNMAFIETDKFLYKAGQPVHVYLLSMNNNMRPVDETFPVVYAADPAGNRLFQWFNQSTNGGFAYVTFTIPDDPTFGRYQIAAERTSGSAVTKDIKVDEYVLPRFNVMLQAPDTITIMDKNVSFEMSVRYTYNQGVPGTVSGRLCRPPANYYAGNTCNRNPDGVCVTFTGELDSEGSYKGTIDLTTFQLDRSGFLMNCILQATVTEQATNVQVTESKTIAITSQLGWARFNNEIMRQSFKKGLSYRVGAIVEDGFGQPQSDQVVELQVNGQTVANLTSDQHGKAEYELDTSNFTDTNVQLQLIYKNPEQCYDSNWIIPSYGSDYRSVGRFYSHSQSFVQILGPVNELHIGKAYTIRVQYILGPDALEKGETTIKFGYMVIARAKTVASGENTVDVSGSKRGEFHITYTAIAEHAPTIQIVVLLMLKDEMVADTSELTLEKSFENQVSANFSRAEGVPGSNVDLDITATPESICLTRVFDYSLLLMEQGATLTPDVVYRNLQFASLNGYSNAGYDVTPPNPPCIDPKPILLNGLYWQPIGYPQEDDTSKQFQGIGLLFISNAQFAQPQLCSSYYPPPRPFFNRPTFMAESGFAMDMAARPVVTNMETVTDAAPSAPAVVTSFRNYFPEMLHMGVTYVGEDGSSSVGLLVPGTITTWKGGVMCLSNNTGFGMTKQLANFTAFQNMFVDISLADSIIRGERALLVASFANYLDKCAKVRVTLAPSDDYTAEPLDQDQVKCVCSHQRTAFSWKINATSLGVVNVTVTGETTQIFQTGESCDGAPDPNEPNYKDIMVRTLTVKAEGITERVTKTNYICTKGENADVQINLHPNGSRIVPGSMHAKVQVMGEMLGRAVTNPESLILQPTGCGEQNVGTMMPIPLVVGFLNNTGRLTDELMDKAKANMAIGYAQQMRYKNPDGSFSVFSGYPSSSWLTLITMQCFANLEPYIPIDKRVLQQGLVYIESLQDLRTGKFTAKGTLFNTGLTGGANDDIAFTCAVVIYLLRTHYAATPSLARPALQYLDKVSRENQSVYNYAMLYHAFQVAGNKERASAMLDKLKSLAIDKDGTLHWQRSFIPEQQPSYLFAPRPASAEILMTATVLSGVAEGLTQSTASPEELAFMAKIANWLIQQQNAQGSYTTTSDTVSTLEALCKYAPLVYQPDAANTVQLLYANDKLKEFNVDQPNRILLQTQTLPHLPGDYSIKVSGKGCVLVQTAVESNVVVSQDNPAFLLSLTTSPDSCVNGVAYRFDFTVNCSYNGMQNVSSMVTIEIPLPSGYSMDSDSQKTLSRKFPKVEMNNHVLVVYLLNMTRGEDVSFKVTAEMGARVENFQPTTAMIYNYYEIDENGSGMLYHPCALKDKKTKSVLSTTPVPEGEWGTRPCHS